MTREEFIQQAAIAIAASLSSIVFTATDEQVANGHSAIPSHLYDPADAAREAKTRAIALAYELGIKPHAPYINRGPG